MKNTIKKTVYIISTIAACSSIAISQSAMADETHVCLYEGAERKISVVYDIPGQAVPCSVTYEKGAGIETLWQAENEAGYCEAKAAEFVEKQRGWGWDCASLGL